MVVASDQVVAVLSLTGKPSLQSLVGQFDDFVSVLQLPLAQDLDFGLRSPDARFVTFKRHDSHVHAALHCFLLPIEVTASCPSRNHCIKGHDFEPTTSVNEKDTKVTENISTDIAFVNLVFI